MPEKCEHSQRGVGVRTVALIKKWPLFLKKLRCIIYICDLYIRLGGGPQKWERSIGCGPQKRNDLRGCSRKMSTFSEGGWRSRKIYRSVFGYCLKWDHDSTCLYMLYTQLYIIIIHYIQCIQLFWNHVKIKLYYNTIALWPSH